MFVLIIKLQNLHSHDSKMQQFVGSKLLSALQSLSDLSWKSGILLEYTYVVPDFVGFIYRSSFLCGAPAIPSNFPYDHSWTWKSAAGTVHISVDLFDLELSNVKKGYPQFSSSISRWGFLQKNPSSYWGASIGLNTIFLVVFFNPTFRWPFLNL